MLADLPQMMVRENQDAPLALCSQDGALIRDLIPSEH
jgi:hypothetical protein